MADKEYTPAIVVTDAGTPTGQSTVTDLASGNSILVPTTTAGISQGIRDVNK
jgi:hypothetical protein